MHCTGGGHPATNFRGSAAPSRLPGRQAVTGCILIDWQQLAGLCETSEHSAQENSLQTLWTPARFGQPAGAHSIIAEAAPCLAISSLSGEHGRSLFPAQQKKQPTGAGGPPPLACSIKRAGRSEWLDEVSVDRFDALSWSLRCRLRLKPGSSTRTACDCMGPRRHPQGPVWTDIVGCKCTESRFGHHRASQRERCEPGTFGIGLP